MRDTFKTNLATSESTEKAAVVYKKFSKVKEDEHKELTASLDKKTGEAWHQR